MIFTVTANLLLLVVCVGIYEIAATRPGRACLALAVLAFFANLLLRVVPS